MARLEPQSVREMIGGMTDGLNVSLAPKNTVSLAVNIDFDVELGSAVSRLGTELVGAQLVDNKTILGLHQFVDHTTVASSKLFATLNDATNTNADIYDVVAGTISLADDTKDLKTRFLTYLGDTLRLNGTDAPKSFNGSSWITTGGALDLANMPTGHKYAIEFLDRVYLAGNTSTPDRIIYSSLPGELSANTISWTSDSDFVDIEPEDGGGPITGFGKVPGYVLIFKERSLKRWNFISAFPETMIQVGTPSQESVVMGGGLCAFYSNSNENAKGFYVTNGGRPECISQDNTRPIKKWVDAITSDSSVAGWATDRGFAWSVGDLTVEGETFNNVVLKYNRILNQWSVRTYPNEFKVFAQYLVSGVNTIVGGDDDGQVWRIDKKDKFTDGSAEIAYKLRTQHDNFNTNRKKSLVDKAIVRGKNLEGMSISVIPDEDITRAVPSGSTKISRGVIAESDLGRKAEGTTLSVELSGQKKGNRVYIREIELPGIEVNQNHG